MTLCCVFDRCLSPLLLASELSERIQGRRGSYRPGDGAASSGVSACLKSDTGAGGVLSAHFLFEHDGNIGKQSILSVRISLAGLVTNVQ